MSSVQKDMNCLTSMCKSDGKEWKRGSHALLGVWWEDERKMGVNQNTGNSAETLKKKNKKEKEKKKKTMNVSEHWNKIPREVVESPSSRDIQVLRFWSSSH